MSHEDKRELAVKEIMKLRSERNAKREKEYKAFKIEAVRQTIKRYTKRGY